MDSFSNTGVASKGADSIDFNKLKIILRTRWLWMLLIFVVINAAAYLYIRYTKNLYESESEIKLEIKPEANAFGIKNIVEDQNLNIISGEIEIIQSRLFLDRVLENSNFEISFISEGRVLNDEMFRNAPATVVDCNRNHSLYDQPISFEEEDAEHFLLEQPNRNLKVNGRYGEKLKLADLELTLKRNQEFTKGDEVGYFLVIHSKDALLRYIKRNLTAEPLNFNANTIRLAFKDHNPQKAQAVLQRIDSAYLQYSNEQKNLVNKQKIDWLTNELSRIEKRMEDYENYFEDFTIANKTNDLDEDLRVTINAINRLDSQRYELARRIKELDNVVNGLDGNFTMPSLGLRQVLPEQVSKNIEALSLLQVQQDKLRLSHNELTFAYRQKQKDFESTRTKTEKQLLDLKDEWVKRYQDLSSRKGALEREFVDLPDKNTEYSKNQRFYKLYEEFYLTLMQSKSEFEIAQAGNIPDFKILSPPSLPSTPISPKKPMILGIGIVMSFVFNFFFIGILYLINNRINNVTDLERSVDVPVLGLIPQSRYNNGHALYVLEHPKSMVTEGIRNLRTNLDFFNVDSKKKVIAVSSTVSGEGKSFIASNLGGIIALSKKKVVLLDLDMRKASKSIPIKTGDNNKGVSTILIRKNSWNDCVVKTDLENFDYIPSGPNPPNPAELLLNGDFTQMLDDLRLHYDFVILDTPPVGLVADGIMAMRRADISIYVFRANYSKRDYLANLKRIISINKISNITTVLNAVPAPGRSYGQGYYEESSNGKGLFSMLRK